MRQRSNLIILFGIAFFLIGGVIVFLVLNDDDDGGAAVEPGQAEVTVFVAGQDIPANTLGSEVIEQGLLTTETVAGGSAPVGYITSAAALDNQIFAVAVAEGDVITTSQLSVRSLSNVSVPDGYDGVAVSLPFLNGGAGYVAPGDIVNIYGVYGQGDGAAGVASPETAAEVRLPRTEMILTNVLVLDVSDQEGRSTDNATQTPEGETTVGRAAQGDPLTYLLALRPTDAERLIQLTSFAGAYVSLTAEGAAPVPDTPGSDGGSVLGPVSSDSAAPQG